MTSFLKEEAACSSSSEIWCYIINLLNKDRLSFLSLIFLIRENYLQLIQFHETHLVMIENIRKNSIIINILNLHHCSFLNEKEIFALCPGVLQSITVDLSFLEVLSVFVKQL